MLLPSNATQERERKTMINWSRGPTGTSRLHRWDNQRRYVRRIPVVGKFPGGLKITKRITIRNCTPLNETLRDTRARRPQVDDPADPRVNRDTLKKIALRGFQQTRSNRLILKVTRTYSHVRTPLAMLFEKASWSNLGHLRSTSLFEADLSTMLILVQLLLARRNERDGEEG